MDQPFVFGIIGAGNIANKFCDAVRGMKGVEVAAVASRTPGKAETFAQKQKIPAAYDNYEALAARPDIDAVYVATTHNFHKENMLLAIDHGKAVLCEKAFTLTKSDAEEVFVRAREKGVFVMEATWSLFNPVLRQAREWLAQGQIGRIDVGHYMMGFQAGNNAEGRMLNPKLAGGAMFDLGIYVVEIMTYLIPQPLVDVQSHIIRGETGVDTVDAIRLIFERAVVDLECLITCDIDDHLDIYGTKGHLHIDTPHCGESALLYDGKGLCSQYYHRLDNGFEYEIQELIDCVRAGKLESDIIPHSHTLQCAEVFDRCFAQNP